jgi:cbb3-type cytochrome oxidase subunit 3
MDLGYIAAMMLMPLFTFAVGVVYGDFNAKRKKQ